MALQSIPFTLQAEDGTIAKNAASGTVVRDIANPEPPAVGKTLDSNGLRPNSTGDGYLDFGAGASSLGDSLTFSFELATAGTYTLHFRYASGGAANRPLALSVNGGANGDLPFVSTGTTDAAWGNWQVQTATVTLAAGTNTVKLSVGAGSLTGPNIDAFAATAVGGTPVFGAGSPPSDVTLSASTVAEDSPGALIGLLAATDPDGGAVTFGVTDTRFAVVGNELRLAPGTSLDFEAASSVSVAVTATDATGLTKTTTLPITVTNVNEAPVLAAGAAIAPVTVAQGAQATVNLATALNATDPEGTAVTYGAAAAGGGALPAGITVAGGVLTVGASTAAGTYSLQATASDGTLASTPLAFTVTVGAPTSGPTVVQAESATITLATGAGTVTLVRDAAHPEPGLSGGLRPGYNGTGYVDFGDDPGDRVTFTVTVAEAGAYDLNIRYASQDFGGQARALLLAVNGGTGVSTIFPSTGPTSGANAGFNVWGVLTESVTLQAGTNTISLSIPPGITYGPNIDQIEIAPSGTSGPDTSADEDATPLFLSGPDGPLTGAAAASINFNIAGRDSDIVLTQVSFDGATKTTVLPDADGDFTVNGSALADGTHIVRLFVTDDAGNLAETSMQILIGEDDGSFDLTLQAETFTIVDADNDSRARTTSGNPEPAAGAGNSGPGLTYDSSGLWHNYTGTGYLDLGNDIGDAGRFQVTVDEAGIYQLTVRYALGATARPMNVVVDGTTYAIQFPTTGNWSTWGEATVDIQLTAGANTISLTNSIANAPNIDSVSLHRDAPIVDQDEVRYEAIAKINFEPAAGTGGRPADYVTPAGYLADTGEAYGARGNGLSYGWVTEASVADGTANGTVASALSSGALAYHGTVAGAPNLQKTLANFEGDGAARAWEIGVENGTYQVKVSVGDTSGALGNLYALNIEGVEAMPDWSPTADMRSTLVSAVVDVNDGRLTIDSIGGLDTEIQYLEIEKLPDLTPTNGQPASADYSYFSAPVADSLEDGQVSIAIGPNGELPTDIDPSSTLVVGVVLRGQDYRGPSIVHTEDVKLVETLTGAEVAIAVQISGGADTLNVRPINSLKENTSYTLKIEKVLDLGSFSDADAPLRQMHDLTTTFVTGDAPEVVQSSVAFNTTTLLDGFSDGAAGFTTVEIGPDGKLYVATINGEVMRWSVNSDGTINETTKETLTLSHFDAGNGQRRGIIGFTFDPDDPRTIWVTDNAPIPRESTAFSTTEFSGRVSKIHLGANLSFTGATADTYISGLPRSGGDHLTNSLEFRVNPNAGQSGEPDHLLYLTQGSNSAAGQADPAWGGRPERLLNAAVLEIDPSRTAPFGGFDVRTEPVNPGDPPTTTFPASQFNADGTYPGMYNPFATDAVLKIYATGVRNAYDLVWHSNGHLYVPANGTAAGGHTPEDPTQPGFDTTISNSPKQQDYLFTVDAGGYYGHPNALRDEYILNGGNPTSGVDLAEVVAGNDGNPSTDGYAVGVLPDEHYDTDGVYALGYNRSPNGAIEYQSSVFGSDFRGALIIAQFSVGDNLRVLKLDSAGSIVGDDVLRRPDGTVINDYIDPLDLVMNPFNGRIYLSTLDRATGASQLVLLTPSPGSGDTTADVGGDLALVGVDLSNRSAAIFQVNGLDSDIVSLRVSFNGGPAQDVTLGAQNRFTLDISGLPAGDNTAVLTVQDDNLNFAEDSLSFSISGEDPIFTHLLTVQAEDRTPGDGTAVTVATGGGAQIVIRDVVNPQVPSGGGQVNGLYPGAFGIDGNTNNTDGVPGGYADFGATNADFMTFTFNAPSSGPALLDFRYANGGTADRPLQLVVNGTVVETIPFGSTSSFSSWQTVEVSANLLAGANTVTLRSVANTGPNIDQLEVKTVGFTPISHHVTNSARLELEATDSSSYVEDNDTIHFFFNVAESGVYRLDTAANVGAANGAGLSWTLNGTEIEQTPWPGSGTSGEQALYVTLEAGTHYRLALDSDAPGANQLDYLDIGKVTTNANADIAVQSLDPAYFDNRLQFSILENPVQNGFSRDMKEDATVRISNTGTAPLQILDAIIDGPFKLANPNAFNNLTLAAGASVNVTVLFDRAQYTPPTTSISGTSTLFDGKLTLVTNDQDSPVAEIDMSGFWQQTWENGQEPNVNEMWHIFGFGNRIEGLSLIDGGGGSTLSTNDVYMKNDPTEILSPYWQIADGVTTASATQLAAFHGVTQAALTIHAPGSRSSTVQFWNHTSTDNQRILPNIVGSETVFATKTFTRADIPDAWNGDDVFGIMMAGGSTDPRLNSRGNVLVPGAQQGHTVKMFQAYDEHGNVLQNVYLGIMDYTGINYDYNDNLFIFEGVKPVGVGPTATLAGSYPDPAGTPVNDIPLSASLQADSDSLF